MITHEMVIAALEAANDCALRNDVYSGAEDCMRAALRAAALTGPSYDAGRASFGLAPTDVEKCIRESQVIRAELHAAGCPEFTAANDLITTDEMVRSALERARVVLAVTDAMAEAALATLTPYASTRLSLESMRAAIDAALAARYPFAAATTEDSSAVAPLYTAPVSAPADARVAEPEWVVNDLGELGVKVGSRFYFCYKGRSLEYRDGQHDDGTSIMWRPVGKREFGETIQPLSWIRSGRIADRYSVEVRYAPGLSEGSPDDRKYQWRPLGASVDRAAGTAEVGR